MKLTADTKNWPNFDDGFELGLFPGKLYDANGNEIDLLVVSLDTETGEVWFFVKDALIGQYVTECVHNKTGRIHRSDSLYPSEFSDYQERRLWVEKQTHPAPLSVVPSGLTKFETALMSIPPVNAFEAITNYTITVKNNWEDFITPDHVVENK